MGLFKRHKPSPSQPSQTAPSTSTSTPPNLTKSQLKLATRTRKIFEIITSLLLLLAVIFLILVNLGSISKKPVLRNWYFIKLDLSHIVPNSVPNAVLINTIAQTLGLHDFYQVGLWGFCEGYVGRGVSFCSKPETLYWFNPVEILTNELLAGASSKYTIHTPFLFSILRDGNHHQENWNNGNWLSFIDNCILTRVFS